MGLKHGMEPDRHSPPPRCEYGTLFLQFITLSWPVVVRYAYVRSIPSMRAAPLGDYHGGIGSGVPRLEARQRAVHMNVYSAAIDS